MDNFQKYLSSKNIYLFAIHLAVVMLAFEVVVLSNQNKKLKIDRNLGGQSGIIVKVGDTLTFGRLKSLGRAASIDTTSPTLAFIFTTTCPFCRKNVSQWKDIYLHASDKINIMGVSLDPEEKSQAFVTADTIIYPVFVSPNGKLFGEANHISTVPTTLLLERGIIKQLWIGLLTDNQKTEIGRSILAIK